MSDTPVLDALKMARGVENPCPRCVGIGKYTYPSTAGWRGGCAGMTLTLDVCDKCWGSGDATKPWVDLRLVQSLLESHGDLLVGFERYVDAAPRPLIGCEARRIERAHAIEAAFGRKRR